MVTSRRSPSFGFFLEESEVRVEGMEVEEAVEDSEESERGEIAGEDSVES